MSFTSRHNKSLGSKNGDSSSTTTESSPSRSQAAAEDRRLTNWRRWLDTHEKIANRLKFLTNRNSSDLLINSHEKFRHKVEIQNLLEAVADSGLPERLNNDLNFWVLPEYLKNRRDPQNPEIAVSLTRRQLKIPRSTSRVFLPAVSQREKFLSLPKPPELTQNAYLSRKLKDLSSKIAQLSLKTSEIDQVAVQGRKIPGEKKVRLKFQEQEAIFFDEQPPKAEENPLIFSLNFSARSEAAAEEKICLDNETFAKIIYEWQEVVLDSSEVEKIKKSGVFHFDKNSDLVLPGRCAEIVVCYRPKRPGAHLESFRLETSPRMTTPEVIFRFWGVCEEPNRSEDVIRDFDDYLRIRERNSAVGEIVEELCDRIESPQPQLPPYALYFLESEVFVAKNPNFSYRCEVVEELKEMFLRAARRDPWGLSLRELQRRLLDIEDVSVRDEMLTRLVELARQLAKPSGYRFLTNSKYEVVYNLLCKFANRFFDESQLVKLQCFKTARYAAESYSEDFVEHQDLSGLSGISQESENNKLITKSASWRVERSSRRSSADLSSSEAEECHEGAEDAGEVYDTSLYCEIFYIRIYELLVDTVDEISAAIESINFLS